MTAEEDYPRLVKIGKISATLWMLATGWTDCGLFYMSGVFKHTFDSMVEGGTAAMPLMTRLLVENRWLLPVFLILLNLVVLWFVWRTKRLSTILLAVTLGMFIHLLGGGLFYFGVRQPLNTVIEKFEK